ncbi:hypothetical protein Q4596_00455 [Pseudoalteromonas carrageenovora]|uniref:hypothetical protein n=1 Tax=Pseudoalteromonas carrageenovora TaxID=227 RepID=UPI0026E1225C|nr:hypothetical protein [Pseudoalteromonas carrageenovora]MDO6834070.1 hypothetical protein [Pseudoalteromonas carrageenovora]
MTDVNSIIHEIIGSTKTVYVYSSKICDDFKKLEMAKCFGFEQIEKLVLLYLEKLTKRGRLIKSVYSQGVRYKKTDVFYKQHQMLKIETKLHFSFVSDLQMQKSLCKLELKQCKVALHPFKQELTLGKALDSNSTLEYLVKKERVYFLQNKISAINTLMGLYKLNSYSFHQNFEAS